MPLDASDIQQFREEFELTQAALADVVGVDSNTVARWERDEVRVPEPAGRLIRLLRLLVEEEGEMGSDPLSSAELCGSIFSTLAGYMEGRTTKRKAHSALQVLRTRGWRP